MSEGSVHHDQAATLLTSEVRVLGNALVEALASECTEHIQIVVSGVSIGLHVVELRALVLVLQALTPYIQY